MPKWLAAVGLAIAAATILKCLHIYNEVAALRPSERDNVYWSVAQLEVDRLNFDDALDAAHQTEDLQDTRLSFNVFFSQVKNLREGSIFASLGEDPTIVSSLVEIQSFLDSATSLINGPDEKLRFSLEELHDQVDGLGAAVRAVSLQGVRVFSEEAEARRVTFEALILNAALLIATLLIMFALALFFGLRQGEAARRQAKAVLQSRDLLASMVNASLDAIVVINETGKIIEFNSAAEHLFGHSHDSALGQSMAELIVPERYRTAHYAGLERHIATGEKTVVDQGRVELSALNAEGNEFPIELSIVSASDETGAIFIAHVRDISRRIAAETEMTEARDRALEGERVKANFIAVMSHEMRNPLNGLMGVLDLMKSARPEPHLERYLSMATSSCEILLRHINDVLDISRIESRQLSLDVQPIDLEEVLQQAVEIARHTAEQNGNQVVVNVDRPNLLLAGDGHRIRQLLLNLIGNAAKFTRYGTITIELQVIQEDSTGADIEITVRDTGIGIPKADHEKVFEDFYMVDSDYQRKMSGSGLGLAICRRIVSALGGQIGVESVHPTGSLFWIRMHLDLALDQAPAQHDTSGQDGCDPSTMKILVVEDNEINRTVARDMLAQHGHLVTEARDGFEGVEIAASDQFDLILMDISMPGMDGLEATRRIRDGDGPSKTTPIFALTAHALPEELLKFREAGMQDCITKPLRLKTLMDTLAGFRRTTPSKSLEVPAGRVDDSPIDVEVLVDLGHSVGPEALVRIIGRVCDEVETSIPKMTGAVESGDENALSALAHKLAGSAGLVGASSLHAALVRIETASKLEQTNEARREVLKLAELADQTCVILSEFAADVAPR